MIIFKTVRWKNFLSTGNVFSEIQLDTSPATLIVGANGAGKSTFLDAMCYALFNKPFRKISKGQLVNACLLYTSPSPRDLRASRMPSSA